ncbi:hypothetical protein [Bacillus sp. m3-13]|nr:hypothetical protein [Bacillus sp. m3-13]
MIDEVVQQPVTNENDLTGNSGGLVNINTASVDELTSLTGIWSFKS